MWGGAWWGDGVCWGDLVDWGRALVGVLEDS